MAEKSANQLSFGRKLALALSQGAMAMGQGMTGQPYLTGYQQNQSKQAEMEAESQLRQMQIQKMQQEMDARNKFQEWIMQQGGVGGGGMGGGLGGGGNGIGLTGFSINESGMPSMQFGQTSESKIREQAQASRAKESETALGKAERLNTIGETVKNQWLGTSPYKGAITKSGMVPILGMWDIIKKGAGATDAQRKDQAYASFISGIRAQLARGMGDVGNLSEYEQRAVIQLVPNLMDSYESGILKLGQLAKFVEDIKKTRATSSSGESQTFTVSGVTYNIPNDKVDAFKKAKGIK